MIPIPAEEREGYTQDGKALLDILTEHDDLLADDEVFRDRVDPATAYGIAILRAVDVMSTWSPDAFMADPAASIAAVWSDGLLTGIEFQRQGGHQEDVA